MVSEFPTAKVRCEKASGRLIDGLAHFVHGETDTAAGRFAANLGDDVLEPLPVLTTLDRVEVGADELDTVALQHPVLVQRDRGVECGLPAQGGQPRQPLRTPSSLSSPAIFTTTSALS